VEQRLAATAQPFAHRHRDRVDLLLAEVDGDVHPVVLGEVLRQLRHDVVDALAAGELLEGVEQVQRVLAGQIGNVRALAVAGLAVTVGAEHGPLLAGRIGLLAARLVAHDLGETLGEAFIGMGEGRQAAEQCNGKNPHGSFLS